MKIIGTPEELQTFREGCNGAMCNNCALNEICDNQYIVTTEYTASELETISKFLDDVTLARKHYVDENGITCIENGITYTTNRLALEKPKIEPILITNKKE